MGRHIGAGPRRQVQCDDLDRAFVRRRTLANKRRGRDLPQVIPSPDIGTTGSLRPALSLAGFSQSAVQVPEGVVSFSGQRRTAHVTRLASTVHTRG